MKIMRTLEIAGEQPRHIIFGLINTEKEVESVYRLRYQVYARKGYIDPHKYSDGREFDDIDEKKQCVYFGAYYENKLIGCIRLILTTPLPTETYYTFSEPALIKGVPREHRGELGRFIIIPPDRERNIFLPRRLVLLFLIDILTEYGKTHGIGGGYSFLKTSLYKKLQRLQMPVHLISDYKERIPKDDVLYSYFTQLDDPVLPMIFITKEFSDFCDAYIRRSLLFSQPEKDVYVLKNSLYVSFLKMLHIL